MTKCSTQMDEWSCELCNCTARRELDMFSFGDVLEAGWRFIRRAGRFFKGLGIYIWSLVSGFIGCLVGVGLYWATSGWVGVNGGGKARRRLTTTEKEILDVVLGRADLQLEVDR